MANWPIQRNDGRIVVTPHGKYGFVRRTPDEGGCGVGTYPCTHWGVDLAGQEGTPVLAPESGLIIRWGWGDKPPVRGYGPGVLLLRGYSGWYHLLGHLHQEDLTERMESRGALLKETGPDKMIAVPVKEGEQVGKTSGHNHVHWEVRRTWDATPNKERATVNPGEWLKQQGGADGQWALNLTTAEHEADSEEAGGTLGLVVLAWLLFKG